MRAKRLTSLFIVIAILILSPICIVNASMTFTADETYLKGSVTVYLPDKDNQYYLEMSGPGGTFNKNNAGSCYQEGDGKITIDYGYMGKGSSFTLKLMDESGNDIGKAFTFTIKAKTKGTFLVQPPENAATPTPIPSPTPTPTPIPNATPTPVPPVVINTPTPSPRPTKEPDPSPTNTQTPVPTDTPTPTPTDTPTPSPEPTVSPTPTLTIEPEPTDTPIPSESKTEVPTTPSETMAEVIEPSESEQEEKKEKKTVIEKIEDAAVNIPGIYKRTESGKVRVRLNVAIASIVVAFLIGFCIMFVAKLAIESKKITTEEYFKGTLSRDDSDTEEREEDL